MLTPSEITFVSIATFKMPLLLVSFNEQKVLSIIHTTYALDMISSIMLTGLLILALRRYPTDIER